MRKSYGFNLIELLIALILISIALFAIAKLQISGMHSMESAKTTTASVVNVSNLVERLSKDRDEIRTYLESNKSYYIHRSSSASVAENCSGGGAGTAAEAKITLDCEVDAWVSATFSTLNLESKNDICYTVLIRETNNFSYGSFSYAIPLITVSLKWKKTTGVDWKTSATGDTGCTGNKDTGLMTVPSPDGDIGYMSMEYIAP